MSNINNRLAAVKTAKEDVKAAIIEKGGDVTDKKFSDYGDIIRNLPSGGAGFIESFTGEKTYASFEKAVELECMNVRGALLWTKDGASEGDEGYLCCTNGDSTAADYWDPNSTTASTPTKEGYTLIAANLGNGYFVRVGYAGLTTTKNWCQSSDAAYQFLENATDRLGYDITKYMVSAANYSTDSIWGLRDADSLASHIYLASQAELVQICNLACDGGAHTDGHTFNNNLGKLFGFEQSYYWSSSQYPSSNNYLSAFYVSFYDGNSSFLDKHYAFRSVALLHFGA